VSSGLFFGAGFRGPSLEVAFAGAAALAAAALAVKLTLVLDQAVVRAAKEVLELLVLAV
jgi:hypothetical protein